MSSLSNLDATIFTKIKRGNKNNVLYIFRKVLQWVFPTSQRIEPFSTVATLKQESEFLYMGLVVLYVKLVTDFDY